MGIFSDHYDDWPPPKIEPRKLTDTKPFELANKSLDNFLLRGPTMNKPLGYIASPYSQGDKEFNVDYHQWVFDLLLVDNKVTPYAPLLMHFQSQNYHQPESVYLNYDNELIKQVPFKWILRMHVRCAGYCQIDSGGADAEVILMSECHPEAAIVIKQKGEPTQETILRLYKELNL